MVNVLMVVHQNLTNLAGYVIFSNVRNFLYVIRRKERPLGRITCLKSDALMPAGAYHQFRPFPGPGGNNAFYRNRFHFARIGKNPSVAFRRAVGIFVVIFAAGWAEIIARKRAAIDDFNNGDGRTCGQVLP